MFKKSSNHNRFFYGQCGDWEGVSLAETPRQACCKMIGQSKEFFKKDKKDTDIIIIMDVKDEMESVNSENVSAFALDSIYENRHE